ncbi:MAG: hypothetical protein RL687_413 [Candidatus Parcubacteria bacterium]
MINFFKNIFNKKKVIIVAHDGAFHADDIFACATLGLSLDAEGREYRIIRTREQNKIDFADFVVDVGGIYDAGQNRFDHHQELGAGARDNDIPYAAFGLVWKTYGEKISGSKEVSDTIEERLVQAIDANDNGIDLFSLRTSVSPYFIQSMFYSFRPSYTEEQDYDTPFLKLVDLAKEILIREIKKSGDTIKARDMVKRAYLNAEDKRIVTLDQAYPWGETISEYPNTIFVVYPKAGTWRVEGVRKNKDSFETRKPMPTKWAGKRDLELIKETGVKDAVFCHNGRWLVVAKSKEGALELANKALND